MNNEYMFRSTTEKITKREAQRRDRIARKHGGSFVGPLTIPGNVGRSWFTIENKGEPFNSRTAKEILTCLPEAPGSHMVLAEAKEVV